MDRIDALHTLNSSEFDMNELALGKSVIYMNQEWTIDEVNKLDENNYIFYLKPKYTTDKKSKERKGIGAVTIAKGVAKTDLDLTRACDALYQEIAIKDKEEKEKEADYVQRMANSEEDLKNMRITNAINRAVEDSRNSNRKIYNLFTGKDRFSKKATDLYDHIDRNTYIKNFEDEEEKKRIRKLINDRITNALDDYPGDLKELLNWMKEHATSVSIKAPSNVIDKERKSIEELNHQRGTAYTVEEYDRRYPLYTVFFSEPETAPEELKNWIIEKRSPNDDGWVEGLALTGNKLSSNKVVQDLIFNPEYKFKLK